jgi:hypothetical protein
LRAQKSYTIFAVTSHSSIVIKGKIDEAQADIDVQLPFGSTESSPQYVDGTETAIVTGYISEEQRYQRTEVLQLRGTPSVQLQRL